MFETTCSIPLRSELFALAIHPREPLLAIGLATGHVRADRLPQANQAETGQRYVTTAWKTRRHKGSCRCLTFSTDGTYLLSAGTDGLLKCARSEDGRVESKIALPRHDSEPDPPTLIASPTPQHVFLATDSSALHLYDLRSSSVARKPSRTYHPHADYVSSFTPLPPSETSTSGLPRQFLTTGGTTVSLVDLRKDEVLESPDLDEELTCSALVGSKTVIGSERGILRVRDTGKWDDLAENVPVAGGEGIESICAIPDALKVGKGGDRIITGMGDGSMEIVHLRKGKNIIIGEFKHNPIDAPAYLGFVRVDSTERLVSGGGNVVKIWEEEEGAVNGYVDYARKSDKGNANKSDVEDWEEDSSDEEEKQQKRRKKRKRGKGKGKTGNHGVMGFNGMD